MHPIEIIFKRCFDLKAHESVLILIDHNYQELGDEFKQVAKNISKQVSIYQIPEGKVNGEEPPIDAAQKLLEYDVIVILTKKSLSHTDARKKASQKGARIASMPSFSEAMLKRCIDIDYTEMNVLTNKLADMIDKGNNIKLTKDDGTQLTFSIKERKAHGRHSGLITQKGQFSNLPDGECFVAPLEGTAEGKYIIDGSVAKEGIVDSPITVIVKEGYATDITGGKTANKLLTTLKSVGKNAFNIAEFGIGTNPKAIITGDMLEDEKVMGTVHIAFGNNSGFDGNINVPLHIDCLIKEPTFYIDNTLIMQDGKFVI